MDNMRGALFMVLAMAGFALEDMMIKFMSGALSVGMILIWLGLGGSSVFAILCKSKGIPLLNPAMFQKPVILRNMGEMIGTLGYVTAVVLTPLSSVSSILQATPLIVTLGAAFLFQEQVGWRRWVAIFIGLAGVLLIIRPGLDGFDPNSIFAVIGVLGLAIRDLATRAVDKSTPSILLSSYGFLSVVPVGIILLAMGQSTALPGATEVWKLLLAILVGVAGYYALVQAMRVGDVSFVTPYRYSRLVFGILIGVIMFHERPDALTLIGAAIIVLSGLYTVWRETRLRRKVSSPRTSVSL